MIKVLNICTGLLLLCSALRVDAQETMFLRATSYNDAVVMQFFPLKPTDWTANVAAAYRVTRIEVDSASGSPKPGTEYVVAAASKPQNAGWFEAHQADEDGLMQAIGALLYDTSFQFKDRSLIDPDSMRWNYVMYEVLNRPYVALATGFLVPDTLAVQGKTYRYDISCQSNPALRVSFQVTHGSSAPLQLPASFDPDKFTFPESRSLSDMIPKLEKPVLPQVFALAKAYGDSIAVRWAPTSADLWLSSIQKGYTLVKYLETKANEFEVVDTLGLFKPWSREQVLAWVEKESADSMAMMAAGLLYNELPPESMPMSEQAQVFQTKYGFALFAAENSALAAQILGLGYMDRKVEPGKTYAYRVIATQAPSAFSQGDAKVKNIRQKGQRPTGFQAVAGDHLIELKWALLENRAIYSAYQLERSAEKAVRWEPLHQGALTFVDSDVAAFPEYAYRDSVAENYVKYRYRLRGMDSFGDWSDWAEVTGEAIDLTPPVAPGILVAQYNDTTNVATIKWELFEVPDDFKTQKVLLARETDGPYVTLAEFQSDVREFIWKPDTLLTGDRSYIIRVAVEDIHGNRGESIERTMLVPDLIAPEPPALVVGNISESGEVTLVWEHSISPDISGYHVMWANDPEHEFSQLNTKLIKENTFSWTIETESLTEYLYITVAAQDRAFNRGLNSKMVKLKRPDKVPPIIARMVSAMQNGKLVSVKWEPSPSTDVVTQQLMRRVSGNRSTEWQMLDSVAVGKSEYFDTTIVPELQYSYALISKDASGNQSAMSNGVAVKTRFTPETHAVSDFKIAQTMPGQVNLSWSMPDMQTQWTPKGRAEWLILRSTGTEQPRVIARTDLQTFGYLDSGLVNGVLYNYQVQLFFRDAVQTGKASAVKSIFGKGANAPIEEKAELDFKLTVKGKNRTILSGDEYPVVEDNTDFGIVGTGTKRALGFSLVNSGSDKLRVPSTAIEIETTDAGVWKVLQPENQIIAAYGGKEDFIIEFQPKSAKIYTAKVKVLGKAPYSFTIRGEGTSKAELEVMGNQASIPNGQALATKVNDTDFEVVQTGNEARHTFSIKNIGATTLTLKSAPRLTGDSVFAIVNFKMPSNGKIAPGTEIPLTVSYRPIETGGHNARLYLLTDDEDEAQFEFALTGVGIGPEINVFGGLDNPITDGAKGTEEANGTAFGKVAVHTTFIRSFTVKNTGSMTLNLSGKPRVQISGIAASEFQLVQEPILEVMPGGGSSTFKIAFTPKAAGKKQVRVYLENNDVNEGVFEFVIDGEGTAPAKLQVSNAKQVAIPNGQTTATPENSTDFGTVKKGQEVVAEFQLKNVGEADFRIEDIVLEGEGARFFSIEKVPDLWIPGGKKGTQLGIKFKPEEIGKYPALLTIKSQNKNEAVYQFAILGKCTDK